MVLQRELNERMGTTNVESSAFFNKVLHSASLLRNKFPYLSADDAIAYALTGMISAVPLTQDAGVEMYKKMDPSDPLRDVFILSLIHISEPTRHA